MAGPSKRSWRSLTVLSGYIVPKGEVPNAPGAGDIGDDSGSDDDEDGDVQWLDMNEIDDANAGVSVAVPKRLCNQLVHVRDKSGRVHRVKGRFPLQDPWWDLSVECRASGGNMYLTTGYPEYRLNMNPSIHLILLFLKKCEVHEDHVKDFHDTLQREPSLQGTTLNFQNLREVVEQYGSLNETTQAVSGQMLKHIESVGGEEAKALLAPSWLRYGPKLLPRRFYGLLMSKEERLKVLETVTAQEPWKLGFGPIMYWEHRFIGCEATLDAFKHCNLLERFPPTEKDAIYIYDFIKSKCRREGHTFVYEKTLHRRTFRDHNIVNRVKALKFLEDNRVTVQLEGKVSLKRYYDYECNIKDGIEALLHRDKESKWVINSDRLQGVFGEDEDQKKASDLICKNPVTVMSGKGGCGKTYVVSKVFKEAHKQILREEAAAKRDEERLNRSLDSTMDGLSGQENMESSQEDTGCEGTPGRKSGGTSLRGTSLHAACRSPARKEEEDESIGAILLTAPTGKAAHLLGKRTGLKAYTLHQVIWSYRHKKRDCKWSFRDVRALVVDESSLVSVQTFSTLFWILLEHASLQKLVLLGDVDQLPSIEPGNFLTDMYHSLAPIGWSIKLRTNHRSESKLIVDNATLISQQRLPQFDPERNFHQVRVDREDMLSSAVTRLLQNGCANDHKTSQFVAFRRKDCNIINEVCCKHYSAHTIKNHKNRSWFQVGDKVCCTKNANVSIFVDYMAKATDDKEEEKDKDEENDEEKEKKVRKVKKSSDTVRLCNGEIFFIIEDRTITEKGKTRRWLTLDDLERQIQVDYGEVKNKGGLKHAWARTIHTYQGSESDTVLYVVGTPTRHQNWQHVYTAVTRGRKEVYVVTSPSALSQSVRTLPIFRNTHLRNFLVKVLDPWRPPSARGVFGTQPQARGPVTALDLCTGRDSGAGPSTAADHGEMGKFTAISAPGTVLGERQGTPRVKAVEADSPFTSPTPAKKRRASSESFAKETPGNNSRNSSEQWSDWGGSFVEEVLEAEVRLSQQHEGQRSSSVVTQHCDSSSESNFVELDNEEFTDSEMWRIGEAEDGQVVDLPMTELHESKTTKNSSENECTTFEGQVSGRHGNDSPDMFAEPENPDRSFHSENKEANGSGLGTTSQADHTNTNTQMSMEGVKSSGVSPGSPEIPIIRIPKTSRLTRFKGSRRSRYKHVDGDKTQPGKSTVQRESARGLSTPAVPERTTSSAVEQLQQPSRSPPTLPSAGGNSVTSPKRILSEKDKALPPSTPTKVQRTDTSSSSLLQSPPSNNLSQLSLESPNRP
ncbi:PREDICTED: DNA helicase B-like isoform X1 [Branchiostoma belcheri]|uniref:DNA helicase B-like isoform X1 n=2 Tax=Branchiostoma belcheri TaxID=7741 RepID=A0A6P4ZYQ0_BRABE|nr:PREDICTED: DNA helicase B-like isoform X1 [Branchiostoma belcheri]